MSIACIIPARGGSKGVPKKNIKELNGFPLIVYSIDMAKQVFGTAYVSTENAEIADIAKKYGAKIIDRPLELASDTATDYDWLNHVFSILKVNNLAIMRPTTPLRCARDLFDGVTRFGQFPNCSSMRSAHEAPESPYKWFEMDKWSALTADESYWKKNPMADLPRQALPKIYIPNGYLDITRRETVEAGSAFGDRILSWITPPVTEIDTQVEFDYLEYTMRRQNE